MRALLPSVLIAFALPAAPMAAFAGGPRVKTGIEVLRDGGFEILVGQRVGLITNATGVDSQLQSTIDILHQAPGVRLAALFGPEHGVRGDIHAGEKIEHFTDPATGVPVYSLYGQTRKPTQEMLEGLDVLVYDIQDIGCRSYTYISTMGVAMEAAAERDIPFVVLDRPNPLGGLRIEGNILEPGFVSFVGQFPIPYVYGLTCGELARMLNAEGMLANKAKCRLTVVAMEGWQRDMTFADTGLPWVPTSPHVPTAETAMYYVATGVLGELQVISEGVGYSLPFQLLGAEWIDSHRLADGMNALGLEGVIFRPATYRPYGLRDSGKTLHGVQIHIIEPPLVNLMSLQFLFLQVHHELYPDKNPLQLTRKPRLDMFDKVTGTDQIRLRLARRMKYDNIRPYLNKDINAFRSQSAKYLLY